MSGPTRCFPDQAETPSGFASFVRDFPASFYPRNAIVVTQNEAVARIWIIASGTLKISVFSDTGAERILDVLGPGSLFGEGSLVGDRVFGVTATVIDDAWLIGVPTSAALRLTGSDQDFVLTVVRSLVEKLHRRGRQLVDAAFGDAWSQVASALVFLSRAGRRRELGSPIHTTQQEIADLLGLSRVTVANALAQLEHAGVLRRHTRRVTVVDEAALRRAARQAHEGCQVRTDYTCKGSEGDDVTDRLG